MRGDEAADAVVTVMIGNQTDSPITLTRVEPLPDAGLEVAYLGHTTCARGCAAAEGWNTGRDLAIRSIDGKLPVRLLPQRRGTFLVFRLQAVTPQARERLKMGCEVLARHVRVTLADGRRVVTTGPRDYVVGLNGSQAPPPECGDRDGIGRHLPTGPAPSSDQPLPADSPVAPSRSPASAAPPA